MIKKIIQIKLYYAAKLFLWRYQPKIIAITGSVGKSSTKEAIAVVLGTKFKLRQSSGNYNNETGLPLSIIGENSGGRNILLWIWIFCKALGKFISTDYPEILVLEVGIDKPGDMSYLVELLGQIDAAVITNIGISHLEFFKDPNELAKEKLTLIRRLPTKSAAILNFDSPKVYDGRGTTKAEVIGYGFNQGSQVLASDFHIIEVEGVWGANFKVHFGGNVVPFFLPNGLGKPAVYAALGAIATGIRFGMNLIEASNALKEFNSPAGRLHLIPGIKHTTILDDTYNAAPASVAAALEVLAQIAEGRKIAAIGSMAELGAESQRGHREIASKIMESRAELVFLVGEETKTTKAELANLKYTGQVEWYPNSDAARMPVQNAIKPGDMILVKGSQAARMEKIVKEIMAEPMRAAELLVRQTGEWRDRN